MYLVFMSLTNSALFHPGLMAPLTQLSLGLCPGWLFAQKGHDGLHHHLHQRWRATVRLDLCHVLFVQRLQSLHAEREAETVCFH